MKNEDRTIEELKKELQALRGKLAALESSGRASLHQGCLNGLPSAIVIKDLEGRYLFVNKSFERLMAADAKDLIGKTAEALFPAVYAARINADDKQVRETRSRVTGELSLPFRGKLHNFTLLKFPLFDESGGVSAVCGIYQDVTGQKQAEAAVREREAEYHELAESLSDPYCALDNELRYTYWNGACETVSGIAAKDALGKTFSELFPGPAHASVERLYRAVLRTGKRQSLVTQEKREGRSRFYETTAYPSRHGLSVFSRDISNRMLAEESLREAHRRFHDLLAHVTLIAVILDADGNITFCNDYLLSLTGWKVEEVMARNWSEVFMPDTPAAFPVPRDPRHDQVPAHFEHPIRTKSGEQLLIRWNNTLLYDLQGAVTGFASIGEDITERKRAEELLQMSEQRFRMVFERAAFGMVVTDKTRRIVSCNPAFQRMLGYSRDELTGKSVSEISVPDDDAENIRLLNAALEQGQEHFGMEKRYLRKDGTVMQGMLTVSVIRQGSGESWILGFVEDITERKRLGQELLKLQKLESIGILAGGIAHDFNNLLTAILGNVTLAKMSVPADIKVSRLLTSAEDACAQAKDLSYRLLTFSKGGEPLMQAVSVPRLLNEAVALALRDSGVKAEFELPSALPALQADESQLKQVIMNIVTNAAEAMPGGGTVRVSATGTVLSAAEAVQVKPGTYLRISIVDRGEGIPSGNLPKIFDPYFTTREFGSRRGRGLGLAICHSIVRKHQGMITVDSEAGKGTSVHVLLPLAAQIAETACVTQEKPSTGRERKRILVMDDEERVRTIVKEMLEYLDYEVECAGEGGEAVELYRLARDRGRPFEFVLLDLTVPVGAGGLEAVRRLQQIDPAVCAVVSSGYADDPILRNFRTYGFSAAIAKPYDLIQLKEALRALWQ